MMAPSPIQFISPESVTDRPWTRLLVDTAPGEVGALDFRVDIDGLLARSAGSWTASPVSGRIRRGDDQDGGPPSTSGRDARTGRMSIGWSAAVRFQLVLLLLACEAQAAPPPGSPPAFPAPMPTDLDVGGRESITVLGRRPSFRTAPLPGHGGDRAPWDRDRPIRDTMTGASTGAFGNAYNLGDPLGSDERSNETGGPYVAPRHD